jgi:hypothetical protein
LFGSAFKRGLLNLSALGGKRSSGGHLLFFLILLAYLIIVRAALAVLASLAREMS